MSSGRVFRFLLARGEKSRRSAGSPPFGEAEAVEDAYDAASLRRCLVVQDEAGYAISAGRQAAVGLAPPGGRSFRVFESPRDFWQWQASLPNEARCFHEVVFGDQPQRLKFDLDIGFEQLEGLRRERRPAGPSRAAEETAGVLDDLLGVGDSECGEESAPASGAADRTESEMDRELVLEFLDDFVEVVLEELFLAYGPAGLAAGREGMAVASSCGPDKFSYHVLVMPYLVPDCYEAQAFTARVLERLGPAEAACVDPGVNKRLQCFRMPGSRKKDSPREKRVPAELAARLGTARPEISEMLVVPRGSEFQVLPRTLSDVGASKPPPRFTTEEEDATVRPLLEARARAGSGALAAHVFQRAVQKEDGPPLLTFRRQAPSWCQLCRRRHESDNSLMLTARPSEDGLAWRLVELCRRAPGRSLDLGPLGEEAFEAYGEPNAYTEGREGRSAPANDRRPAPAPTAATAAPPLPGPPGRDPPAAREEAPPAETPSERAMRRRVESLQAGRNPHEPTLFERLPPQSQLAYDEPAMRPYPLVPTLAVRAQMGVGKTQALRDYIERHFPASGLRPAVIRFVTFRQTFSRSLLRSLEGLDFVHYADRAGPLGPRIPRLIVQSESLHRLAPPGPGEDPPDLVVLDESESILAQFDSGLHRDFYAAFAVFRWLVASCRHLVCLDANLGDRTFRVVQEMRRAGGGAPPFVFHWNRYALARQRGDVVRVTASREAWLASLLRAAKAGQRLVVPSNSLAEAETVTRLLRERCPALAVRLYSSRTPGAEKTRDFGDLARAWAGVDVLVYTPTLSAGVSYEAPGFDALYGFFGDNSCDVETCRQMLGRVRQLGRREMCLCIQGRRRWLPTDLEELARVSEASREALRVPFDYDPATGARRVYRTPYHQLCLENLRCANLSRSDFVGRFLDQVAETGARLELLGFEEAEPGELAALRAARREARGALSGEACARVAQAAELSPGDAPGGPLEPAEAVRRRIADGRASEADLLAYEKFSLRRSYYAWTGELTPLYVQVYGRRDVQRVFRGLVAATRGRTLGESLRLMRERELWRHGRALASSGAAEAPLPAAGKTDGLQHGPAAQLRPADVLAGPICVSPRRTEGGAGRPAARELPVADELPVTEEEEVRLLRARPEFYAHSLAVWLLRLCGFSCLFDTLHVQEQRAFGRFAKAAAKLAARLPHLGHEFGLSFLLDRGYALPRARPDDPGPFIDEVLRIANAVLRRLYGLKVERRDVGSPDAPRPILRLGWTATGGLFRFSGVPDRLQPPLGRRYRELAGLRPVVRSALRVARPDQARFVQFIEDHDFADPWEDGFAPPPELCEEPACPAAFQDGFAERPLRRRGGSSECRGGSFGRGDDLASPRKGSGKKKTPSAPARHAPLSGRLTGPLSAQTEPEPDPDSFPAEEIAEGEALSVEELLS